MKIGQDIFQLRSFDNNFPAWKIVAGRMLTSENEIILDEELSSTFKLGDFLNFSYITDKQKERGKSHIRDLSWLASLSRPSVL